MDLQGVIKRCFECPFTGSGYRSSYKQKDMIEMIIPTNEDIIEIPVFVCSKFSSQVYAKNNYEAMVVNLSKYDFPSYKTIPSKMKEALLSGFLSSNPLIIKSTGESSKDYFATCGAIFNEEFNPVMMLLWQFQKEISEDTTDRIKYKFLQPILRVSPSVFIYKNDSVMRYIINKIVTETLKVGPVVSPASSNLYLRDTHTTYNIKVEISPFHFEMKKVACPSISTTDKELLNVALENIDDIM